MDEKTLEIWIESPRYEMMHDSVSEVRSEDLPLYRISHDECGTRAKRISPFHDLLIEPDTLTLIVELEFEGTIRISLVSTTVIVGSEDVGE